ncbi:MAG: response regulator [bacterium]|nr:response regulator [bacterium]
MSSERPLVLVVDDDEDFRVQLGLQLEAAGYAVTLAAGESAAEAVLAEVKPDLAIVDLMMEHADGGFVLSYRLKKRYPDVPVVMVTGVAHETGHDFATDTAAERAWIKADAVLVKPVRFEQLKRELSRLLPRE